MKKLRELGIFLVILALSSCEKEIKLDLEEGSSQVVVEGLIHDGLGDNFVRLSRSSGYYDLTSSTPISAATVEVKDDKGGNFTFTETLPGYYTNSTLQGEYNTTYSLVVDIDGKIITSTSIMPPVVPIDSLEVTDGFNNAPGEDPTFSVRTYWTDPLGIKNFYRFKAKANGKQVDFFQSTDDVFVDGIPTAFPLFDVEFFSGDTVIVQLLSVDEPNFRYFTALELITGDQGDGTTPGNPPSNLVGEALGYFGAYSKAEKTIIIP